MDDQLDERSRKAVAQLVDVCRSCKGVLLTAAEVAESIDLRRQFHRRAAQWARLENALSKTEPNRTRRDLPLGDTAGTLQRAWIKIKSAMGDMDAIAAECDQRESHALRQLEAALDAGLPHSMRSLLLRFARRESGVR